MEEQVRKLNRDYGFALSEEEIQWIARQGEEYERLFRCLYEIDLTGVAPMLKLERKPRP
jgi:Asp-tRNA(Asn)/Glu-tRNA(Gln) amidotransferase C subunit